MNKISISLTPKWRLDLKLTHVRGELTTEPFLPSLKSLRRVRRGNKFSRFFRHIFQHKRINRIFGANLAVAVLAGSTLTHGSIVTNEAELGVISVKAASFETETSVRYPLSNIKITQNYSYFHPGIDFDGITGDPIYPMMGGTVTDVQYSKYAYGNAIIVDHGEGLTTLYAHLSRIEVAREQIVDNNTKIGEMGATGRAFGDHLHFEVREHGIAVNPLSILPRN